MSVVISANKAVSKIDRQLAVNTLIGIGLFGAMRVVQNIDLNRYGFLSNALSATFVVNEVWRRSLASSICKETKWMSYLVGPAFFLATKSLSYILENKFVELPSALLSGYFVGKNSYSQLRNISSRTELAAILLHLFNFLGNGIFIANLFSDPKIKAPETRPNQNPNGPRELTLEEKLAEIQRKAQEEMAVIEAAIQAEKQAFHDKVDRRIQESGLRIQEIQQEIEKRVQEENLRVQESGLRIQEIQQETERVRQESEKRLEQMAKEAEERKVKLEEDRRLRQEESDKRYQKLLDDTKQMKETWEKRKIAREENEARRMEATEKRRIAREEAFEREMKELFGTFFGNGQQETLLSDCAPLQAKAYAGFSDFERAAHVDLNPGCEEHAKIILTPKDMIFDESAYQRDACNYIKPLHRKMVLATHPDHRPQGISDSPYIAVQEAYNTLRKINCDP